MSASVPLKSFNRATNQANLTHLVSRLNVKLLPRPMFWQHPEYGIGRLREIRKTVTELIRYERIEKNYYRADFSREYAERLISEAIRYGDCHKPTMELACWWLTDKTLVPKLFKVLAERYRDWPVGLPYTRMLRAPKVIVPQYDDGSLQPFDGFTKAVLELRGNPYPPLPGPYQRNSNPGLLHNVLLEEARKDYFRSQSKIQQKVERQIPEDHGGSLASGTTEHLESTRPEGESPGPASPAVENK